jgi:hypothetical protein
VSGKPFTHFGMFMGIDEGHGSPFAAPAPVLHPHFSCDSFFGVVLAGEADCAFNGVICTDAMARHFTLSSYP